MKTRTCQFNRIPCPRSWRGLIAAGLASAILIPGHLRAQTGFTFTGAKSNLWDDPMSIPGSTVQPNWTPQTIPPAPPNDADADVMIPGARNAVLNRQLHHWATEHRDDGDRDDQRSVDARSAGGGVWRERDDQ